MTREQFSRTELLLGKEGVERLISARVAVFGLGGVGGFAVEALARSGIGGLALIDSDEICVSNLNRQILATRQTIGRDKVDVATERIREINPDIRVNGYKIFYLPETADGFDLSRYDYVVDAIDTVSGKVELAARAVRAGIPIISCMGTGNKMDPTALEVGDIYGTSVCPLARAMRRELKKRGIERLKVVWSAEPPMRPAGEGATNGRADTCRESRRSEDDMRSAVGTGTFRRNVADKPEADRAADGVADVADIQRRQVPGSNAFVPATAGLILAGEVVRDLTGV